MALGVALSARAEGAYGTRAWGALGLGLVAAVAFLAAFGLCLSRRLRVAVWALVAVGLWAVVSVAWGGLPQQAWTALDRSAIAAAALVLGAWLAAAGRRNVVLAGVLAGIAAQTVEILVRTGAGSAPEAWFNGRLLEGPVGYHNAQALLCAVALPLAVWAASARALAARVAGGAAAAPLLAVLFLTQSRAALAAAGIAVAVQTALARRARTAAVAAALVGAGALLALELRSVDRGLLTDGLGGATPSLRTFALVTAALAAAVAVVAALPSPRRSPRLPRGRALFVVAAVAALVAAVAAAVLAGPSLGPRVQGFASDLVTDAPPASAPGTTRFTAITLDGRREAWRVAVSAIREHPLTGDGVGRYAVRWGVERRLPGLYILQPHSLELELGAELGLAGLLLFGVAVWALAGSLRRELRADRAGAAAGAAVFVALLAQTAVDWTWSFPGILAPVFLVVGAAAAPVSGFRARAVRPVVLAAAAAALVVLAVPTVAAVELARGDGAATTAGALQATRASLALDPWNADAVAAEGRLLESEGRFQEAAARYADAARLSQRPWIDWFRRARAFQRAGALPDRVEACLLAQRADPAEDALHAGPCGWPWLALHHPGTWPPGPEGPTRPSAIRG